MDNSLLTLIDSATSILVVLPSKPYFDQVAAGLSLYLAIHDRKEVSIYCPTPMMVGSSRLVGVNKISQEIGKKNLTIRFASYDASNIDKVGYDIDKGEFKLTVTPKSGFIAPEKDQIILDYSGTASDLVILIGGANDTHFPILASPDIANAKIVHIGVRQLATDRQIMSFARPASTTSEIVATLIKDSGLTIDGEVASNLIMGIEDGSNNFASPEVTPETFELFAFLLRSGGQRSPRIKLSPAGFPAGSIPTKPYNAPSPRQPVTPAGEVETQAETNNPDAMAETPEANPPSDWLQPKIYKGAASNPSQHSGNGENIG